MSFELQIVLKTTFILGSAGLLSLLLKNASAAVRHAVWMLALLAVLVFPMASALLPPMELPILPEKPSPVVDIPMQTDFVREIRLPIILPSLLVASPIPSDAAVRPAVQRWSWQQWLLLVWAVGAMVIVGGWAHAVWQLRRLKRDSVLVDAADWIMLLSEVRSELAVKSRVQLRIAAESVPPMTWGVLRHVILLPSTANEWLPVRRRLVLEHEMAHVKRHDGFGQVLAQAVCSLYWFNPLVWYAAHRLHAECERACDDAVLRLGVDAADYAGHLVEIARGLNSGFARTAVSMANPSQLKCRVLAILDIGIRRRRLSHLATAFLCAMGLLTVSAAAVRLTAAVSVAFPELGLPHAPIGFEPVQPQALSSEQSQLPVSIQGVVIQAGTNNPVENARVILNTDPVSDTPLTVMAGDNGKFEFRGVPPGKYQLLATREGYALGVYGQRALNGPGAVIDLRVNQTVSSAVLTMTPLGTISGHVRNRFGEPAGNVAVRAFRRLYEDGQPGFRLVQTTRSNDLGEYRLYYLDPGPYVISATPPEGPVPVAGGNFQLARLSILPGTAISTAGPGASIITAAANLASSGVVSLSETGEAFPPIYFPGVADPSAATPIDVKAGGTFTSADFVVSEVRAARIRGSISDSSGQPVKAASVVLLSQGIGSIPIERHGGVSDTGAFEFRGIAPGSYDLIASVGALPLSAFFTARGALGGAFIDRTAVALPTDSDARLVARLPIRVGSTDIENFSVTVQPGYRIKGRIAIEGRSPAEAASLLSGVAIQLGPGLPEATDNDSNSVRMRRARSFSMPGAVAPDGTFVLAGVFPGVYQIGIRGAVKLPEGSFVKSIRMGDTDLLSPRFLIEGVPQREMEIVIGTDPGSLQATVLDARQSPARFVTVVLVPDSSRVQRYEHYFKAVTDASGSAQFNNVPPGEYQAYAWDVIDNGAWWDAEFLRKFEGRGQAVRIGSGGKHTVDLKSISNP